MVRVASISIDALTARGNINDENEHAVGQLPDCDQHSYCLPSRKCRPVAIHIHPVLGANLVVRPPGSLHLGYCDRDDDAFFQLSY